MKLSILILGIQERWSFLYRLNEILKPQVTPEVEIKFCFDNRENTVGHKRNLLLEAATGKYIAFIDDDDTVAPNYIELLLKAIDSDCDCASLKGMYSVNGKDDGIFEHSIKYKKWETVEGEIKYLRTPNHLNCIKATIAKQFKFPELNHGEDFQWSTKLHKSGLLKTEFYIPEIIYYYRKLTMYVQPKAGGIIYN